MPNEANSARTRLLSRITYSGPVNWMRKHDHGVLTNAVSLLVCGLLAGLVVAAAAFPAAALTGLAAKAGADGFDNLPSLLQVPHAPQITNVYASDGKTLITSLYDENRRDVPINQISKVMLDAVVAAEDKRFYDHNGVDIRGVVRAFVNDQKSDVNQQGASTLTMQYVRLATSYSATTPQEVLDATEDSPARKIREMHLAIALEKQLTDEHGGDQHAAKLDILDRYLNIAPFGHGAYGIYAASEVYFNKPPSQLKLSEAALIAGLLQGTTEYDPTTKIGLANAEERRNQHVLPEMLSMGLISKTDEQAAIATKAVVRNAPVHNGCTTTTGTNNEYGYFCDYLYRWWLNQPTFGADTYERENQLETGGYKIVSTLDVKAQIGADKAIHKKLPDRTNLAMMLASVEPDTGYVDFVAVNRKYANDQSNNGPSDKPGHDPGAVGNWPNTTIPLVTGDGTLGYQFGSTFKLFTMIAALEAGIPLTYTINTQNPYKSNFVAGTTDQSACAGPNGVKYYCPTNAAAGEKGSKNMWAGFGQSVNTYFVPIEDRIGVAPVMDVASRLGITISPADRANTQFGSFTLGVVNATPLQMAAAYATIANSGKYCAPTPVRSITDPSGNQLAVATPQCKQVVDPRIANVALDAARCPVSTGSYFHECQAGTSRNTSNEVKGRPIAGKTGTTDSNVSEALIAMTPQLAVAGVVANPDNPLMDVSKKIPRSFVNSAVGQSLNTALAGKPVVQFAKPDHDIAFGTPASVPKVTCASVGSATSTLQRAGFRVTIQKGERVSSACGPNTVAMTDPSGAAQKGVPIAVYLSNGTAPVTTPPSTPPGGPPSGGPPGGGGGNGKPGGGGGLLCPPICGGH
jgi:membrane peptidoglycan carboxypeptidase